jgi:hypothetical protein
MLVLRIVKVLYDGYKSSIAHCAVIKPHVCVGMRDKGLSSYN